MEKNNNFLRKIARLVEGGLISSRDFKNEVENELKFKLEEIIAKLDLVSREEFEVQKKLYEKLKNEVEIIKKNRKRKKIKKAK
tara:strand:+ start:287 stop:535 length:249 start_codon:yes stop_codon:yes gene_type:complete